MAFKFFRFANEAMRRLGGYFFDKSTGSGFSRALSSRTLFLNWDTANSASFFREVSVMSFPSVPIPEICFRTESSLSSRD